jgi:spore coat polysaccharide biosynthesis protein SpsF (cytidylyltransferase family)
MNIALVVPIRTNSKRFPNKIFKKIEHENIFSILIKRLFFLKKKYPLIIATSQKKNDETVVKACLKYNVSHYRGSLNNVLKRFIDLAEFFKLDYIVRINGDSPLIDHRIILRLLKYIKKKNKYDLITNIFPRTYPIGQSVEIINTKSLKKIYKKTSSHDREHVTSFFYKNSNNFKIKNIFNSTDYSHIKMAIDEKKDYLKLKKIYKTNPEIINYRLKKLSLLFDEKN